VYLDFSLYVRDEDKLAESEKKILSRNLELTDNKQDEDEENYNLNRRFDFSPNIVTVIKSRMAGKSGFYTNCKMIIGRAMAQAVSRRPLTA
jgi:hypothetical protein